MNYIVETTLEFENWLNNLKDRQVKNRILARLVRVESGNFGDYKVIGDGISELRIHAGSGYRLYYTVRGNTIILMLAGGDKSTQNKDIIRTKQLKKELI